MHDLEGLFCKTENLWNNAKFAGTGKKHAQAGLQHTAAAQEDLAQVVE